MKTRKEIEAVITSLREELSETIVARRKKALTFKIETNNKYLLILDNFNEEQLITELQKNKEKIKIIWAKWNEFAAKRATVSLWGQKQLFKDYEMLKLKEQNKLIKYLLL